MIIKKLLLADDEIRIREGLYQMVQSFNLPLTIVGTAKNGEEALSLAEVLEPDILLVDINMPKMSGLEFIKRLNESSPKEKTIIIISGFDEFEYARQAISLGVAEYLLKPIKEAELKEILKRYTYPQAEIDATEADGKISVKDPLIADCLEILKDRYADPELDLTTVADKLAVNPDHLSRKLKQQTSLSFKEWLIKLRMQKSMELLQDGRYAIYEIAEMTGFSNQNYFSTAFKNYTGTSPTSYLENLTHQTTEEDES